MEKKNNKNNKNNKLPNNLLQKKTKQPNNTNNNINNNNNNNNKTTKDKNKNQQNKNRTTSKNDPKRILHHADNNKKKTNESNNNNNTNEITNTPNNENIQNNNQNQNIQNNNENNQNNQNIQNDNQNQNIQNNNQNNENFPPIPQVVVEAFQSPVFQNDPVLNLFLSQFQNNNQQENNNNNNDDDIIENDTDIFHNINNNNNNKNQLEITLKKMIPSEFNKIFNIQQNDYQSLLNYLESKESNKKLFCTKLFNNEGGIICKECSLQSNAIICFDCFELTKNIHKNHNVIIKTYVNGNCDCGNPEIWKEESFCKNHKINKKETKKNFFDNEIVNKINKFFDDVFNLILPYFIQCEEENKIINNKNLFNVLNIIVNFIEKICDANSEIFEIVEKKLLENKFNIETNHKCISKNNKNNNVNKITLKEDKKKDDANKNKKICICSPLKILLSVWTEQNNKLIILLLKNQKLKEEITFLYFPMFKIFYNNEANSIFDSSYEILIAKSMENAIKGNNYINDVLDLLIEEAKKIKINTKYYKLDSLIAQFINNLHYLVKKNTIFYFKDNLNFYFKLIDFLNEIENLTIFKIIDKVSLTGYSSYVYNIENNTTILVNFLFSLLNFGNKTNINKIHDYFLNKINNLHLLKEDEFSYNIALIRGYSIFLNRYCFYLCKINNSKLDLFDSFNTIAKTVKNYENYIEKIYKITLKNISFILSIEFNFWVYYGQEMFYLRSDYFSKEILFLTDAVLLKYIFSYQFKNKQLFFNLNNILEITQISNSHKDFIEKLYNNSEKLDSLPDVNFIEDGGVNKNINLNSKIFDYLLKILRNNIIFLDLLVISYDMNKFGDVKDEILDDYLKIKEFEKIKLMVKEKLIYLFLSFNNLLSYSEIKNFEGYKNFLSEKTFQDIFLSISNKNLRQNEQVTYSLKEELINKCDLVFINLPNYYSISEKYIINFKKVPLINTIFFENLEIQKKLNLNCLKNYFISEKNISFIFNLCLNIMMNKNFDKLNSYLLVNLLRSILTIFELNKQLLANDNDKKIVNKKLNEFNDKIKDFDSNDKDLKNYLDYIKTKFNENNNNDDVNNDERRRSSLKIKGIKNLYVKKTSDSKKLEQDLKNLNQKNPMVKKDSLNNKNLDKKGGTAATTKKMSLINSNNNTYNKQNSIKKSGIDNSNNKANQNKNTGTTTNKLNEKKGKLFLKTNSINNNNNNNLESSNKKEKEEKEKKEKEEKEKEEKEKKEKGNKMLELKKKFQNKNLALLEKMNIDENTPNKENQNENNNLENPIQEEQKETEMENCLICQKPINLKEFESKCFGKIGYLESDKFIENCKNNCIIEFYNTNSNDNTLYNNNFYIKPELVNKKFRLVTCNHNFHYECFKNHVKALNINNEKNFIIDCPLCKKKSNCLIPNLNVLKQNKNKNNENNENNFINGLNCFEENLKTFDKKNIDDFVEKNPSKNLINCAQDYLSNFIEINDVEKLTKDDFNKLFNIFKDFYLYYQITQKKEIQIEIIKNFILSIRILLKSKQNKLNEELFNEIFDLINKYKKGQCFNKDIIKFIEQNIPENDLFKLIFIYLILFDKEIPFNSIFNLFFIYYCFLTYIQKIYIDNKLKISKNIFEKNIDTKNFDKFLNEKNNKILLKTFETLKEKIYFFMLLSDKEENKENLFNFDFSKIKFNDILSNSNNILKLSNKNLIPSLKNSDLIFNLITSYKKDKLSTLNKPNDLSIIPKNIILLNSNIKFSSINLDEFLFDFSYKYQIEKCNYCKKQYKIGLICLMCGEKVCNTTQCVTNNMLSFVCHTIECGGGNCVYVDNDNGEIFLVMTNDQFKDSNIFVYLNNLGETVKNFEITKDYKLKKNELTKVENIFTDLDFR